jgi:hypothetical protein
MRLAFAVLTALVARALVACGSSGAPVDAAGGAGASGDATRGGVENATGGSAGSPAGGAAQGGSAGAGAPDGVSQPGPATTNIVDRTCVAGAKLSAVSEGDPSHPNRTTGDNGVFIDECDASGVLTEFVCSAPFTCVGPCAYVESGQVAPLKTNCAIGCRNGACLTD